MSGLSDILATLGNLVGRVLKIEAFLDRLSALGIPASDHTFNIRTYGAIGDATVLDSNVTTTNGSAVISCPSASFTQKLVGQIFAVRSTAGTLIVNSTVASVQSGTQLTLNATANASTSTGTALYGTDNTTAIQAAIDAAYAFGNTPSAPYKFKGAKVRIPGKQYLTGLVTNKNHVTIEGVGEGSVLVMKPGSAASAMIVNDVNGTFIGVRHLRIDGKYDFQTQSAGAGPHGISYDYSASPNYSLTEEGDPYPQIHDITIYNVNGTGIKLIGRGEAQVSNVRGRNILGDGLTVCFDSHIMNCSFGVIGGAGVNIGNSALGGSVRVSNTKCFHCGNPNPASTETWSTATHGGSGFYVYNSQGVALSNCEAQDCAGAGFSLDTVTDSVLTGCVADTVSAALGGDPGFNLANSQRNIIIGHVRDRKPAERNSGLPTVRHAVRTWFSCSNNDIRLSFDLDSTIANYYPVYPTSMNANADGGLGEHIVVGTHEGNQSVAYAATITPNPYLGGTILVGTLTGNITVANTAAYNKHVGVRLTFVFTQDATGGRTVTWGTDYKTNWTPNTAANKVNTISFVWSGSNWIQVAAQTGL